MGDNGSLRHRFAAVPGWHDIADDAPAAVASGSEGGGDPGLFSSPDERRRYIFLRDVPVLRNVDDDVVWRLARVAREERFEPGEVVLVQGDDTVDKRFYIIAEGIADVVVEREVTAADDEPGDGGPVEEEHLAALLDGDYFGELGLLANAPRNATIKATSAGPLHVMSFDAIAFQGIVAEHVLIFRIVRAQRRGEAAQKARLRARAQGIAGEQLDAVAQEAATGGPIRVRELGLFSGMPLHDLSHVLRGADQQFYPAGTTIIEQGEEGDRFYVILEGMVEVERDGEHLADLGGGDFFGETALLFGVPRTATVRATRPTLTWSITREAFERVMRHYLLGDSRMRDTVAQRLKNARTA